MSVGTERDDDEEGGRKEMWIRGGYALLFVIAFELGQLLLNFAAVVQFLLAIVTRRPNATIADFGRSLAIWQAQTTAFLTYATDDMPFPFAPWPNPDGA